MLTHLPSLLEPERSFTITVAILQNTDISGQVHVLPIFLTL